MSNNTDNEKKYASLSTLQMFLDNLKTIFSNLGHKHTIDDLTDYTVDSYLSSTSVNPVENKVVTDAIEAVEEAIPKIQIVTWGADD